MRVLIQSYSNFAQNKAGGVYSKVASIIESAEGSAAELKPFDKWHDKLKDYDIIHYFGLKPEYYEQMQLAKNLGLIIIISSILTPTPLKRIKAKLFMSRHLRLRNDEEKVQWMLKAADAIITETRKEKGFVVSAYGIDKDKVHVIPNGISDEVLGGNPALLKNKLGIKNDFVLQVGRFDTNKNQLAVIRAMRDSDIPVVFIGGEDPAYKDYYETCLNAAQGNCYFVGWLDHSDPLMASAYAGAKVVVLPSYHEVFGNAIFEGAMNGANIVATNVLPLEEFGFSANAIAISPNDIDGIRTAIESAYQNRTDEQFAQIVKEKYSLDSVWKQHLSLYTALCK